MPKVANDDGDSEATVNIDEGSLLDTLLEESDNEEDGSSE
jgi:hypothetical protein